MFENIIFIIPGMLVGVFAGFMPGIGIFASMMLLLPFLHDLTALQLLTFYVALASTTQYIGSITATVFGLPGEASSLPAVREGHQMYKQGRGSYAISGAAIGSFLGGFLMLLIVSAFLPLLDGIYKIYSTRVMATILITVTLVMCFTAKKIWLAVLFAIAGYLLGLIGCRYIDDYCFATFGNADITTGLPLISVICAIYIFPNLIKGKHKFHKNQKIEINFVVFDHLKKFMHNSTSAIRGTFIGFFAGFTPGLSTAISSNLAYTIEKWWQTRKRKYKLGNYRCLVSAETANNAGAFSCLLPLFVFGIPLVPSEALLYELASVKGFILGQDFTAEFFLKNLTPVLFITNLVAIFLAWPLAKYICVMHKIPTVLFRSIIFVLMMSSIYFSGVNSFQGGYHIIVFLCLLPVGYLLRDHDTLPLIFVYIIQDRLDVIAISMMDLL
jgi:putative tricarboxylic transport membrane protein